VPITARSGCRAPFVSHAPPQPTSPPSWLRTPLAGFCYSNANPAKGEEAEESSTHLFLEAPHGKLPALVFDSRLHLRQPGTPRTRWECPLYSPPKSPMMKRSCCCLVRLGAPSNRRPTANQDPASSIKGPAGRATFRPIVHSDLGHDEPRSAHQPTPPIHQEADTRIRSAHPSKTALAMPCRLLHMDALSSTSPEERFRHGPSGARQGIYRFSPRHAGYPMRKPANLSRSVDVPADVTITIGSPVSFHRVPTCPILLLRAVRQTCRCPWWNGLSCADYL